MQLWGFTFQNGFFSEVLFEISLKKWTFEKKSGVVSKKDHKNWIQHYIDSRRLLVYIKMAHGFITKLLIFFFQSFLNLELLKRWTTFLLWKIIKQFKWFWFLHARSAKYLPDKRALYLWHYMAVGLSRCWRKSWTRRNYRMRRKWCYNRD